MRHRSDDDIYADDFPYISGQGSLHDLSPNDDPEPRLWFAKSVSPQAARALNKQTEPARPRIGFHRPQRP